MAVSTEVLVRDPSWKTIANASNIRLRRRLASGEASFRVEGATTGQLELIRTGRECEISITVDGNRKVFGGFIDRPRVQVDAPGSFNVFPRVVDLSQGAAWRRTVPLFAASGTKYTDNIKDYWAIHWSEVDRSGVEDHASTHPEQYSPGFDTLASFTNEIVQRFLPDWVWWVGHNGRSAAGIAKKLFVQPRGHTDKTHITIGENDVGYRFEVQPVVDPRNKIIVVGDEDISQNWPKFVTVDDTYSQSAYGVRDLVTKESEVGDTAGLRTIGRSVLEKRKFDLWQGRFQIHDWSIEPGDKVNLYLPTIGVNNGPGGVPWVLMEVEETVQQGKAERFGTFVEHNDAAFFRVT